MKVDGIAAVLPGAGIIKYISPAVAAATGMANGAMDLVRHLSQVRATIGYVGQEFLFNAVWPLLIFGPVPFISYLASFVMKSDIWKRS